MAEAAYAAGPAHLAILGGPALIPKKFIQMITASLVKIIFCDLKSKSIVSYLEVSIPTIRHAAYGVPVMRLKYVAADIMWKWHNVYCLGVEL